TLYRTLDTVGRQAAWLALWPLTGRTHQLRVHCAAIGAPIAGDGKYGGAGAFISADGVARSLHLHARALSLPHPSGKGELRLRADLPPHMAATWRLFGLDASRKDDPFADAV
ncbi:MAG: RluA family pseudouridine synthase, partial [Alphaproteobacteria bacterium]